MQIDLEYIKECKPRYNSKPHEGLFRLINAGRERYANRLEAIVRLAPDFRDIPAAATPDGPYWGNGYFSGLDAIALTGMIQNHQPALYVEIGSGNSTKFARRAVRLYSPKTRIISIDPEPRSEIDAICDEVIRVPLETLKDFTLFDQLSAGDFLFLDGSHCCLMNSDVTVMFLDVVPRLKPGVIVHLHDIFLPWDYPQAWVERYYSEHYLLACWLLAGQCLRVELPNMFISRDKELSSILDPFWSHVATAQREGGSFWFRIEQISELTARLRNQGHNKASASNSPTQLVAEISRLKKECETLLGTIALHKSALSAKQDEIDTFRGTLNAIHKSHGWRALSVYYRLRDKLLCVAKLNSVD